MEAINWYDSSIDCTRISAVRSDLVKAIRAPLERELDETYQDLEDMHAIYFKLQQQLATVTAERDELTAKRALAEATERHTFEKRLSAEQERDKLRTALIERQRHIHDNEHSVRTRFSRCQYQDCLQVRAALRDTTNDGGIG